MRQAPDSNPNISAWWLLTVPLFVVIAWAVNQYDVFLLMALPVIVIASVAISFLRAWLRPSSC